MIWVLLIYSREDGAEAHLYNDRAKIIDDLRNDDFNLIINEDQINELEEGGTVELDNGSFITLHIQSKKVH